MVQFIEKNTNFKSILGLQYQLAYNTAVVQTNDVPNAIKALVSKKTPTFEKL